MNEFKVKIELTMIRKNLNKKKHFSGWHTCGVALLALSLLVACTASNPSLVKSYGDKNPLRRTYTAGEILTYEMTGKNQNHKYVATSSHEIQQGNSTPIESVRWVNLNYDSNDIELPQMSQDFRQILSLDNHFTLPFPAIAQIESKLIGPVFDLMTFYVDLRLGASSPELTRSGDHVFIKHGIANSWANGASGIIIGEDCIDFDLTLDKLDSAAGKATLIVKHVPPANSCVRIPAEWMKEPVGTQPNNWVQVEKKADNKYIASVGYESFDVSVVTDLSTGKILSASMYNPVEVVERICTDSFLTICGESNRYQILREISIKLK